MESDDEIDFIGFSTPKEESNEEVAEAIALAKQLHVYKPGIEFVHGSKLEVLDTRDNNWYQCKVVEANWPELDVRVHYEKWSTRFDEWLKMDSTRIRPAKHSTREFKKSFYIKEKVLAYWAPDGKYYSAEVIKLLSEDCWNVLFYDGFTRSLRSSYIKKLEENEERNAPDVVEVKPLPRAQLKPEPAPEKALKVGEGYLPEGKNNIFNIKILEEKRKSKRNPDVEKLFQSIRKRKRSDRDDDEEVYGKSKKRSKPIKTIEVVDLDSTFSSSDEDSTGSNSSTVDTREYDSDSNDSIASIDSSYITALSRKRSVESIKEDVSSETINIGELASALIGQTKLSSYSGSPRSLSSDDTGFRGFDEASSAEKYRHKETLSSLLGISMIKEGHSCPKNGCGKSFRKEKLLRMHMKHYHPNLIKADGVSGPNTSQFRGAGTMKDQLEDVKHISQNLQSEVKKFRPNLNKNEDIKPSTSVDLKQLKEESLKTFTQIGKNSSFHSSRKGAIGKKAMREFRRFKKNKCGNAESLTDSNVQEFTAGRTRRCKKKGSANIKVTPPLPVENDETTDSLDKSDTIENNDPDAIINCRCGFIEEDGLMLQCDICLCWQHGSCYHIDSEDQVPNSYICSICENSYLQRSSMRFRHHQDWLKEGKLPRFSGSEGCTKLQSMIKRCQELKGNVLSLSDVMHSLDMKIFISKTDDHPKLVMWHEKWKDEEDSVLDSDEQFERTSKEKVAGQLRGDRHLSHNDFGEQLQHIDRLTGLRINGASGQQNCITSGIKTSFDENEDNYSNEIMSDRKPQLDKQGILKYNAGDPRSVEGLNDFVIKKEHDPTENDVCKVDQQANSSESKHDNYWKSSSLQLPLIDKIKIENQEETPEVGSLEQYPKEEVNMESRAYFKVEPIPDDQKEVIDEVFDFNLPGLVSGTNVSPDLTDLLTSNAELERLVHQASTELAPMDSHLAPVIHRVPIIPQAERILPVKCKLNLLEHIEKLQNRVSDRFNFIEDHLQALESEMGLNSKFSKEEEEILWNESSENKDEITLQARSLVCMSLRDLETASKLINYKPS